VLAEKEKKECLCMDLNKKKNRQQIEDDCCIPENSIPVKLKHNHRSDWGSWITGNFYISLSSGIQTSHRLYHCENEWLVMCNNFCDICIALFKYRFPQF
jgi:hypothetical protein